MRAEYIVLRIRDNKRRFKSCANQISMQRVHVVTISIPRTAFSCRIFSWKLDRRRHRIWNDPDQHSAHMENHTYITVTRIQPSIHAQTKPIIIVIGQCVKFRMATERHATVASLSIRLSLLNYKLTLQIKFKSQLSSLSTREKFTSSRS